MSALSVSGNKDTLKSTYQPSDAKGIIYVAPDGIVRRDLSRVYKFHVSMMKTRVLAGHTRCSCLVLGMWLVISRY